MLQLTKRQVKLNLFEMHCFTQPHSQGLKTTQGSDKHCEAQPPHPKGSKGRKVVVQADHMSW